MFFNTPLAVSFKKMHLVTFTLTSTSIYLHSPVHGKPMLLRTSILHWFFF